MKRGVGVQIRGDTRQKVQHTVESVDPAVVEGQKVCFKDFTKQLLCCCVLLAVDPNDPGHNEAIS